MNYICYLPSVVSGGTGGVRERRSSLQDMYMWMKSAAMKEKRWLRWNKIKFEAFLREDGDWQKKSKRKWNIFKNIVLVNIFTSLERTNDNDDSHMCYSRDPFAHFLPALYESDGNHQMSLPVDWENLNWNGSRMELIPNTECYNNHPPSSCWCHLCGSQDVWLYASNGNNRKFQWHIDFL